ncbi:MAG: hypothetical protein C5B59_03020 [Bacteroidetes bacterium]|nr:MAG: hypothetical protein C5B59_03020 [Bacteroidota bacterium]
MSLGKTYLESAIKRLAGYKELSEKAFAQLEEGDFYYQPNRESNSIAVIIQHISGNMLSRWTNFLTEDGEKTWRQRDDEFDEHNFSKEKLMRIWDEGWECCLNSLRSLSENDLEKTVYIRGEAMPAIDAINRQLAHYPYHVGQILYIGRIIRDQEWKNLSVPKRR